MPPFLIIHGDKDVTVPVVQSEYLDAALQKVGADVTLHDRIKGGGHNLINPETDKLAAEFFDKYLLKGNGRSEDAVTGMITPHPRPLSRKGNAVQHFLERCATACSQAV